MSLGTRVNAVVREVRDGEEVVVAQLGDRELVARDRCPHRGAPLSQGSVQDDCLVCPYHGWRFNAEGDCVEIPALGPSATIPPRARLNAPVSGGTRVMSNTDGRLGRGWHPVCRREEVEAGATLVVELLGDTWAVTRDVDGTVRAEAAYAVADHLGHIWLAPDEPVTDLLAIPEFDEDGWTLVPMPRWEGRYGVGLLLDNQLDAGHFSFVHRNTFGNPRDAALPPYDVNRRRWGFDVRMRVPISARNDVTAAASERPVEQFRVMTYRYDAPAQLFLRLDYEQMGGSTGIFFYFTPLSAERARVDVDLLFRHPDGFTREQLAERLAFEIKVVGEDMALQDAFGFVDLPLTLASEIHTRADKSGVEMRRIINEMLDRADC